MSSNEEALASLPTETLDFIKLGRRLEYPRESCECGEVTFLPPSDLRIQNFHVVGPLYDSKPEFAGYMVRAVDLLASVEHYYHLGVFAWLVDTKMFATYDGDHQNMIAFQGVSWAEIARNAAPYLSMQWNSDAYFEPWNHGYAPSTDGQDWFGITDIETA